MIEKLKSFGWLVLGLGVLVLFFGATTICQYGYGQIRPNLPGPVRSFIGGDSEYQVNEYFDTVEQALDRFVDDSTPCSETRDQPCLTKAWENLLDRMPDTVPASASWMDGAHAELMASLTEVVEIHRQSETDQSILWFNRSLVVQDRAEAAFEDWLEQADR